MKKSLFALMSVVMLVMPLMAQTKSTTVAPKNTPPSTVTTVPASTNPSPSPTTTAPAYTQGNTGTSATSSEGVFSMFTSETLHGMIGSVVYFLIGLVLLAIGYKVVDFITPGNLSTELLGTNRAGGVPNYALAIVAGSMLFGLCIIIAAAIH